MLRHSLALLAIVALTASAHSDDAKRGAKLGKKITIPSNIGFSTNVSDDAQAATVLFDNLDVVVEAATRTQGGAKNQTAVQTKTTTIHVPYSTDQRSVSMKLDVRGNVGVDAHSTARLIVCAGGTTHVVDLTPDDADAGRDAAPDRSDEDSGLNGNFEDRLEFTLQTHAAKPVCQLTLILVVEHDTDKADTGGATLTVDALDLEITGAGNARLK